MLQKAGKVLVVEHDPELRHRLNVALYDLGFDVGEAATGREAIALCRVTPYEAVILGEGEEFVPGVSLCSQMRQILPRTELMVIGSRDDPKHRIEALEGGADDYLSRPVDFSELAARLRNAFRRASATTVQEEETIRAGEFVLDVSRRSLLKSGKEVRLTPKEFGLLAYLMRDAGRPKTHARILQAVWGLGYEGHVEYLRTFVRQLRKKLEDDPAQPQYLLTDSHVGYRFVDATRLHPAPKSDSGTLGAETRQFLPHPVVSENVA